MTRFTPSNLIIRAAVAGLLCTFLEACTLYGTNQSQPVVKTCLIPSDQSGTVSAHWTITPIPIALASGAFSSDETSAIATAAQSWNTFFTASKNINIINYGTDASNVTVSNNSDPNQSGGLCVQGILQNNQFSGNVVIYKMGTWPSAYPQTAIALTNFCTTPTTPYPQMYMAVIEVNYQQFFVNGQKVPDLQSILLHELGHLIGLNHSCEAFTKTGTPNCNDPNLNPDYVVASMFPSFSFDSSGQGQQRRSLGTDDEERANCLY